MMVRFIIALIFLQITTAWGSSSSSLNWQKLSLEEKVQRKYNATLGTVLKDNQYLVEVEVEAADPGGPNFKADDKKSSAKVSDLNLEDSRGDYIAFSKVGLEVPVVEKFLDEDRTKLLNLYRFNEAYDLFKNLDGVSVTIYLSDKIPQDLMEIAKKLVTTSKFSVAGIKPTLKFETTTMEWIDPEIARKAQELEKARKAELEKQNKKEEKEPKIWTKDWLEWASRWGNAVGLILGSIIVGLIALFLFRQWSKFMERYAALQSQKNQTEEKESEEDEKENQPLSTQEEEMSDSHGYERFKQCLENHSDDAITIIRSWLNDGDELSVLALRGIAQEASPEEMEKLMNGLTEQQRDKWKSLLGHHLEGQDLKVANKHIFQEVVKSFLVPSRIKDGELLNLVMELGPKSTCDFLLRYKDQIGILMNILSPAAVGKVLAQVEDNTADEWLMKGSEFDVKTMEEKVPHLKDALKSFKELNTPAPFAQRIMAMIPVASPAREGNLYRALARAGSPSMVVEVASQNFPSELIVDLPAPFLKEVMQSYPVHKRVELLFSRPEEQRSHLLEILAESGTPARDMLDMELENITRDPSRISSIEGRSDEIWQEFVKSSRIILSKSSSYTNFSEQLVKEWCKKLSTGLELIKGSKAA
jgi:hypothetical protein